MTAAAFLIATLSQPALAWNHTQGVWDRDLFPLEWWVSDYSEDSLSGDYDQTVLVEAFDHWVDEAPCAELSHDYLGVREGHHSGFTLDSINTFYYDDPVNQMGTGVLGVTLCIPSGEVAFNLGGDTYLYSMDCDILFNTDIDWGETADIDLTCASEYSVEAVATHEIGHLWGMGHSCEQNENCPELDERYATMYWAIGPCSTFQAELKEDDVEGITSLYGPYATFYSESERFGGVPLEVCFNIESNETIGSIDWTFGDGESSSGSETPICHTYTEAGQYTVGMSVTGSGTDCGEWNFTQRELAYVLACEAPHTAEGFDGLFTYQHVDGLVYQMLNQADTTVYGCIERVQWDVFQGDELIQSINAWSPKIEFPAEGSYRVVLNLGGPDADDNPDMISADEITIEVEDRSEGGCSAAPVSAGLFGLLAGLGLVMTRRRRD